MAEREDLAIVCTDQVPCRATLQGGYQLYGVHENPGRKLRKSREDQNDGQAQNRGRETQNAEKYRITIELHRVILDYVKP